MKEIDLYKLKIFINDFFVIIKYKKKAKVHLEDAIEIFQEIHENTIKNKKYGLITDIRELDNMSRRARDFFGSKSLNFCCNAILISNKFHKIISDLYIQISNPIIKSKSFYKEKDAKSWIIENLDV